MIIFEYGLFSLIVAAIINKGDTVVEDGVGRDAIVDVSAVNGNIGDISVAFISVDVFIVLFIVSGENIDAKFFFLDVVVRIVIFVVFVIVFVALVVECDVLTNDRLHTHGGGGSDVGNSGDDVQGGRFDDVINCEVVVDAEVVVVVATLVSVVILRVVVCSVCEIVSFPVELSNDVTVVVLVGSVVFSFTSRSSNVMSSLV